jgi:hypothetical protein
MALIDSGKKFDKDKNHEFLTKDLEARDMKPYLLNIPAPLFKKVKRKLVEDEKNMREILIECLYKYINE